MMSLDKDGINTKIKTGKVWGGWSQEKGFLLIFNV